MPYKDVEMPPEHKKKLIKFTVQKNGGEMVAPRWREVEVENATCPDCFQQMTVIIPGGDLQFVYAHCCRCRKYFIGD